MMAQFSSASPVEAPRCGSVMTCGWSLSARRRKVAHVGMQPPGIERGEHRVGSSTIARAREIEDRRLLLACSAQARARSPARCVCVIERHVHGDRIGAREQILERQRLLDARRQLPGALHGDLRIVAEHASCRAPARSWPPRRRPRRVPPPRACAPAARNPRSCFLPCSTAASIASSSPLESAGEQPRRADVARRAAAVPRAPAPSPRWHWRPGS